MTACLNKISLIGYLGCEPRIRTAQNGNTVVTLSMATHESWRDSATGERRENTQWHRVVIFNPHHAKVAAEYLHKGYCIYVEGQLRTRKWTDSQGVERILTEVAVPKFKGELVIMARGQDDQSPQEDKPSWENPKSQENPPDLDDDIPF